MQEAQWQAAKSNLVPCHNCQRRFAPDRIGVHERVCKGPKKPPPTAVKEVSTKYQYQVDFEEDSDFNSQKDRRDRTTPARRNMSRASDPGSQRTTPCSKEFGQNRGTPRDQQSHGTPRDQQSRGTPRDQQSRGTPRDQQSRGTPRDQQSHGTPRDQQKPAVRSSINYQGKHLKTCNCISLTLGKVVSKTVVVYCRRQFITGVHCRWLLSCRSQSTILWLQPSTD